MKLKNFNEESSELLCSNVIIDDDITLTDEQHEGESLKSVIGKTDRRLDRLESNVKWIYENGGVGSGGSGGGGGSTKWHVKAMLGGTSLDTDKTISFTSGVGVYILRIWIDGGSGEYNVSYQVNNVTQKVKLNVDNGWATEISLDLNENATIAIIAKDGIISREITGVKCIVKPYVFNAPVIQKRNGTPYTSSGDIIISDALRNGLFLKSSYVIAVPFESEQCTYRWLQNGVYIDESAGQITQSTGDIIYEVPDSLLQNENAGLYNFQLQITLLLTGDTDSVTINYNRAFNLIPDGLYLKVSPANENEIFYNSNTIEDPYCFSTNTKIGINVRIYNGLSPTGLWGNISWLVDGSEPDSECNGSITIQDGYTTTITTYFVNEGWNKITFSYMLNGESGESIVKYFYCQHLQTNYNWFFDNGTYNNNPSTRRYYIPLETIAQRVYGIDGPTNGLYIEKRKSDTETTWLDINKTYDGTQYSGWNQMFNFGIQYSDINNPVNPIIKCYDKLDQEAIVIYQNKIEFKGQFSNSIQECNIFLHKEVDYDVDDKEKYHLLTINVAICYSHGTTPYYEITAYLDGKTEGTVETLVNVSPAISRIELQNENFSINHIEISSWGENENRFVYDTDVCWYYNSFADRSGLPIDSNETDILQAMYQPDASPDFTIDNQLVKVNTALPSNIAGKINVPIMVITCNREIAFGENNNIFTWMNGSYEPEATGGLGSFKLDIKKLEWCGGQNKQLGEIKLQDENEVSLGDFQLKLQGTSTMRNKAKNFTLSVQSSHDVEQQGKSTLFSPNFISSEASTFLPETAFTLKADDVDSSHSNNTSIGKFVNQNNAWGYRNMINLSTVEDNIKTHVKQCLEGFSMLLFLNVDYKENNIDYTDCYYLGIYNFNLGRNSYFNLGYSDLSQLHCSQLDESALHNNGFAICTADVTPVTGFIATEIQDNQPYWDFSQYDSTVLFQLPGTNETSDFMFGDFVTSSSTDPLKESTIRNLVKSIAGAGGYLFNYIHKEPVLCNELLSDNKHWRAYHDYDINIDPETNKKIITTYVSDVTKQFKRERLTDKSNWYLNPTPNPDNIDVTDTANLTNCIIDDIDNDKIAPLDYASVVYYYVTCMVFGLVDSVQKNLNIKTWSAGDNAKSGVFFYDMDTSLGRNNAGNKTAYFAFSDYWKTNLVKYDSNGDPTDDDEQAVRYVNEGIDNFRDTFLFENGVEGYDIPSSFLFAIAKYAYLDNTVSTEFSRIFPQQIYAEWRNTGGVLSSADNFIDTYFASNLKNIPNFLISLNYRNKYLYGYNDTNNKFLHSTRLHGTGVEETRDWLRGRLRILDAYFNITKSTSVIYGNITEPKHNVSITNPDVNLLSDIFISGQEGIHRSRNVTFKVTAPDYSPLVVTVGQSYTWYIFENSNIEYETLVKINAGVTIFGGSQLWRTLDSINGFVESRTGTDDAFVFNSKAIENMIGTSGIQGGRWLVTGPALEEISLTSPNYGGTLTIDNDTDNKFYSIKTIDIHGSKISLNINNCPVKTIDVSDVKGKANIVITNCNSLTSVNLSRAVLENCTVTPTWTDTLNFSNVRANNVTLQAIDKGKFTANNNSYIKKCDFSNMENITINNCANLQELKVTDPDNKSVIKKVNVTKCPSLTTLVLNSCENLEELNLYGCTALEEITIKGTSFNNLRILGLGNTKVWKMTIGGTTYSYDLNLTMFPALAKDDNGSYVSFYKDSNITSVQFNNHGDVRLRKDPNYTGTHAGSFEECFNLRRIYGSFLVECIYCFYGDSNFSVHGDDLSEVTWKGQNVLGPNKKYLHPSELNNNSPTLTYWPNNGELGITNMKFNTSSLSNAFYGTKYTIFDLYYLLYGCTNVVETLSETFRNGVNSDYGKFYWDSSVDNSPDVRMFNNCGSIKNLSLAFYNTGNTKTIRFKSPQHNELSVTQDDGLFSPLVSLENWDRTFGTDNNYNICIDRFLFRRVNDTITDQSYNIKELNGFYIDHILDNVNSLSNPPASITTSNYSNRGNLEDFFINLQGITGNTYGLFDYCNFINFSTLNNIPKDIVSLTSSFCSLYGTGEINLSNHFQSQTKTKDLYNSFCVSNKLGTIVPTMTLDNNTFSRFYPRPSDDYDGLVHVGYSLPDQYRKAKNIFDSCFSGEVSKQLNNQFPFDIFSNLPHLEMASCVFMNADGNIGGLKLPGRLFQYNTELKDCSGIFYNLKINYEISETYDIICNINDDNYDDINTNNITWEPDTSDLTKSPNFTQCPLIENVSYMFGSDEETFAAGGTRKIEYIPKLSGMIPRNLFWHGIDTANSKVETIYGRMESDSESAPVKDCHRYIIVPKATISDMTGCFKHCNCRYYEELNIWKEPNPDYSPYDIITDENGNRISDNYNKNEYKWTADWFYDGESNLSVIKDPNNSMYLSDNIDWTDMIDGELHYVAKIGSPLYGSESMQSPVKRYICPPDLLRFCKDNVKVDQLFAYSGTGKMNADEQMEEFNNLGGRFAFGITGRICPYMLKPVPKIESVSEMFRSCKRLSYIYDSVVEHDFLLPTEFFNYTPNIYNLDYMFFCTIQPNKLDMSRCFINLTRALSIQYIFANCYWEGIENNPTYINEVFRHNSIYSLVSAFAITGSIQSANIRRQYVNFNNVFDSTYSSRTYASDSNFSEAFRGYYDDSYVQHEDPKTLCDNTDTNNYKNIN